MTQAQTIENTPNIAGLLEGILTELRRARVSDDLWTVDDIAAYLKKNRRTVQNSVLKFSGFPLAVRVPSENGGKSNPLWVAKEVKAWALRFKESVR